MKLSKEAAKAKYQYNKKYQEAYWERRAQRENGQTVVEKSKKKTVTIHTNAKDFLPDLDTMVTETTVKRERLSDAQYIKALEAANRTMRSENRRLIRLLRNYQDIIRLGLIHFND